MDFPSQLVDLLRLKGTVLAAEWGLRILLAVVVIGIGLVLTRLTRRWVIRILERTHAEQAAVLSMALGRIVLLTGVTLVMALTLAVVGVNVAALVAGLGLTSMALAAAANAAGLDLTPPALMLVGEVPSGAAVADPPGA